MPKEETKVAELLNVPSQNRCQSAETSRVAQKSQSNKFAVKKPKSMNAKSYKKLAKLEIGDEKYPRMRMDPMEGAWTDSQVELQSR